MALPLRWTAKRFRTLPAVPGGPLRALAVFDEARAAAVRRRGFLLRRRAVVRSLARWMEPVGRRGRRREQMRLAGSGQCPQCASGRGGPRLYVGVKFDRVGGRRRRRSRHGRLLGRSAWSGFARTDLRLLGVYAFTSFDDGGGPALHAAGSFTSIGNVALACRPSVWQHLGTSPWSRQSQRERESQSLCRDLARRIQRWSWCRSSMQPALSTVPATDRRRSKHRALDGSRGPPWGGPRDLLPGRRPRLEHTTRRSTGAGGLRRRHRTGALRHWLVHRRHGRPLHLDRTLGWPALVARRQRHQRPFDGWHGDGPLQRRSLRRRRLSPPPAVAARVASHSGLPGLAAARKGANGRSSAGRARRRHRPALTPVASSLLRRCDPQPRGALRRPSLASLSVGNERRRTALASFADASGSSLRRGVFTTAGGTSRSRGSWRGDRWEALGAGLDAKRSSTVWRCTTTLRPALYVGGSISQPAALPSATSLLARGSLVAGRQFQRCCEDLLSATVGGSSGLIAGAASRRRRDAARASRAGTAALGRQSAPAKRDRRSAGPLARRQLAAVAPSQDGSRSGRTNGRPHDLSECHRLCARPLERRRR